MSIFEYLDSDYLFVKSVEANPGTGGEGSHKCVGTTWLQLNLQSVYSLARLSCEFYLSNHGERYFDTSIPTVQGKPQYRVGIHVRSLERR